MRIGDRCDPSSPRVGASASCQRRAEVSNAFSVRRSWCCPWAIAGAGLDTAFAGLRRMPLFRRWPATFEPRHTSLPELNDDRGCVGRDRHDLLATAGPADPDGGGCLGQSEHGDQAIL